MLTRLQLKNFKPWADTSDVPLRPITGLFGTNSSGKTSLLQALLLLKQTSESSDRGLVLHFGDKATPVNLGDFRSVVYTHNPDLEVEISLDWQSSAPLEVLDPQGERRVVLKDENLGFSVSVCHATSTKSPSIVVKEMSYRVGKAAFGMRRTSTGKGEYELFADGTQVRLVRTIGRPWPLPAPVKSYGFPDQVKAYYQNAGFLADLELALEQRLRNVYYLGPLRAYPERRYTWAGAQPIDMGRAGESVVDALLSSRERGEKISRGQGVKRLTLEAYVAYWLKRLGLIHDFRVDALGEGSQVFQVKVRKSQESAEVLITDVGFGVSQILPVLVLCFYVPEGSTVILEQPEIHLHPAVQAGLADVLIDAWKKRRVQVLLESHSEHLLRRLQRRVAEKAIGAEDIGLFFCERNAQGSELTSLNLDLFGRISNWPKDFFGDEFGEIAAISKAALEVREGHSE